MASSDSKSVVASPSPCRDDANAGIDATTAAMDEATAAQDLTTDVRSVVAEQFLAATENDEGPLAHDVAEASDGDHKKGDADAPVILPSLLVEALFDE